MQVQPILIVTQDVSFWECWQSLREFGKKPYRGIGLPDLLNWRREGNVLALVDMACLNQSRVQEEWSTYFDGLCVLVLSAYMSDAEGHSVLAKGASGYAHSHLPIDSLVLVVRTLESGGMWLGRNLLQKILHDIDQRLPVPSVHEESWASTLSSREVEVARLAAVGDSNAEIALQLSITERTVRAHLSAVFDKLRVDDRLKLALKVHGIHR